ncbi:MAG: hypothetical protein ACI4US_08205 [Muribaculaceae bacterium]
MDYADIEVSLVSIRQVPERTKIFSRAIRHYAGGEVGVSLRTWLTPIRGKDEVELTAEVVYSDRGTMMHSIMLTYCVAARFAFSDAENFFDIDGDRLLITHHLLTLMLGTVIGALRGMIALDTAQTSLASYPLPLLNVADLAASLSRSPMKMAN